MLRALQVADANVLGSFAVPVDEDTSKYQMELIDLQSSDEIYK